MTGSNVATEATCERARQAATRLLKSLAEAQVQTRQWADTALTTVAVSQAMTQCLEDLSGIDLWGEANRMPSYAFWQIAGDVLQVGWLQFHARTKPRGYAGDFEMLQRIYDRTICDHPLGRAFDLFFQSQAATDAVRFRTEFVASRIVHAVRSSSASSVQVVSVGSGPAIDVELACRELTPNERRRVVVTLLDLDPEALIHAHQRLQTFLTDDQLRLHRENLFRLPRLSRASELLGQADVIACTGLFDYLSDADLVAMLRCFGAHLNSTGELLVCQFTLTNSSRAYMEWIGNWYLTYRDATQLANLLREARLDQSDVTLQHDPSQSSLVALCRK